MTRAYGNKRRTKADKKAAAIAFVTLSNKSDVEKINALVRSYGFRIPEAEELIREVKARMLKSGVRI